ncbi:MAG: RNA polymerase sigma factor [Archangium sp.]|nr:RNA polymerase sigma factor [Archangium sp.]
MPLDVRQAWQRYHSPVREKCRRVLGDGDEANDVAQETFIRFWKWEGARTGDARAALSWLYRTATHLAVDRLRQRAMHGRAVPMATETSNLESAAASRQLLSRISAQASEEELQAAVLNRIDGLTQPEVARLMNISERTVRRLLERFDGLAPGPGSEEEVRA